MYSANFKISHLLYKGYTVGLVMMTLYWCWSRTEIWLWYSYVKMSQWLKPLFSGGTGGGIPRLQEVEVLGQKHFSGKLHLSTGSPPWLLCIMLYTCSYIFFLMATRKMISFNEQHKNLSLQKIFYLHCVCIFSLSYLRVGGGEGVSLSIKSIGKMHQIFLSVFPLFLNLCCALV